MTELLNTGVRTKRAYFYGRVSTVAQAGEHHASLETQEARARAYCELHGLVLVSSFIEVQSGRRDDRVEYRRMVDRAIDGGAEVIVVQFLDRFGRNPREILSRIWEFQDRGIQVVATDEDIQEELSLFMRSFLAGAESKRTSERVRSYMSSRAAKGVHFGRAPYGYRRTKINDEVVWEQEPDEALAVREMYRLSVEENRGFKAIADHLSAQRAKTRGAGHWAAYTVQHILHNEALAGTLVYGKEPKPGNPERELVRVEDFFPAILTRDEWDRLQERLAIRRGSARGRTHTSEFLLSGMVRCGHCGGPMVGRTGALRKHREAKPGERYRNYWCSRAMTSRAACGFYNGHSAPKLEAAVLDYLGQYSDPAKVRELLAVSEQREVGTREKELRQVERRLTKLDADLAKNVDLLRRSVLNEDEFNTVNAERRDERASLESRRAVLSVWVDGQSERADALNTLPSRVGSFLQDVQALDTRRAKALLQTILSAAHVHRDGRIELEFRA